MGADGIREKDGVKLAPRVLFTQVAYFPRVSEAIQGYMRKIGIDWKIMRLQLHDRARRDGQAGLRNVDGDGALHVGRRPDEHLLRFASNIPTPNRMNWKDAETDDWLKLGRAALTEADRAKYYALVQRRVTQEHLWMPVMNVAMYTTSLKKLKGVRPHMLYQNTFYKGLDYSF